MSHFIKTPIADLYIYKPKVFGDHRGYFFESFNANHFRDQGLNPNFVQDNRSFSKRGTLRGMHMQMGEHAQAKLVSVLRGKVFDVAIDLRPNSSTYGKWHGVELNDTEIEFFYIPRGFAHAFIVLSDEAEFFYKVDNYYNKESEAGISYNDPDLNINWQIPESELILSDKDKLLPTLKEFTKQLKG